ncbi:mono-functional DNA-alkylating methyl methanesulfonate N-term-domain-containing protein [Bombardia bombarda]|uniref:Mono-functional DNA-alkylating methyl methanesulfonate N-term-domain-containing protein n=1 Tax=Bombardia bombarda TaxID=252184 RepID=A0AA39XAB8_9PEZI|nr:mono-functional DNA-alkylating methyl methanesulfonate N-term-domain-containing protein [Bombardia bombarda]
MAFQTNVLRGGEWVTETVDLQAVLKANSNTQAHKRQRLLKPPQCGLLTRTVFESQLVNSILPVRLRSLHHNDVAFVSDRAVKICEFQEDGQLRDIARKNDFGSRIKNACVLGSVKIDGHSNGPFPQFTVKPEDGDDLPMSELSTLNSSNRMSSLPPQLLILVLDCGDCVFLYLRTASDGTPEFVTSAFPSPREQLVYPGFHMAVDPSSRYMALACAKDLFVVYELESLEKLNMDFMNGNSLDPVRSYRPRTVQGVIQNMTFLHPRPGDDHHIILLLVIVRNGKSRMVTYEWELENNLSIVFSREKPRHRMPVEHQMPVLVIPLTVQSAFIAISQDQMALCTEGLHGPPHFEILEGPAYPTTEDYQGRNQPLWTAWARPFRLSPEFEKNDYIYLTREDGVVWYIQITLDSGAIDGPRLTRLQDVGIGNIANAFTCLYVREGDILIIGGNSGPGSIWKHVARVREEKLGELPAWSPTVDFMSTDEFSTWNQPAVENKPTMVPWQDSQLRKPDRLFATSRRGNKGSITEYRYGLKADITLDILCGDDMKEAWFFPVSHPNYSDGFHLLLSKPGHSTVFHISEDPPDVIEMDPSTVLYDLSSSTLAAVYYEHLFVQITKQNVVLLAHNNSTRSSYEELWQGQPHGSVSDACIIGEFIAISTHTGTQFQINTFSIDTNQLSLVPGQSISVDGEITCLTLGDENNVYAALWRNGRPFLIKVSPSGDRTTIDLSMYLPGNAANTGHEGGSPIEPISSIVYTKSVILLGTRSGEVITLMNDTSKDDGLSVECEKFGWTTVNITRTLGPDSPTPEFLVSCDRNLVLLKSDPSGKVKARLRVLPVDANDTGSLSPPVDYAAAVNVLSSNRDGSTILLISQSRLLLAELHEKPGPVHRHIPVEGTPTKLVYSHTLQCLIVAVKKNNQPALIFLDPDTGEDIGRPTDKAGNSVDNISGLGGAGKTDDGIYGLAEWEYKKDGNVWRFILVSTKAGRLIVVSTAKVGPQEDGSMTIRYWTRFKKELDRPVYSVLGYEDGVIYCVGQTIHWDAIDATEKKLKHIKAHELGSPATSLRIVNGKLLALTSRDSLEVIDHSEGDTTGIVHVDPKRRNAIHLMEVAGGQLDEPMGSIILVADRDCGVGGLWVPWQIPKKDCEQVFEADLPSSIRRFRRGRTRPIWEQGRHVPKYGRLVNTIDDAEILGISLDGSMQHFTLLNIEIWRFLRFVQNMASTSTELYPFTYRRIANLEEFDPEPRMDKGLEMHVDGDMLQRCFEKRALERLISLPGHFAQFMKLLDELEDGKHTSNLARHGYYQLAYDIIEYFLQPVL